MVTAEQTVSRVVSQCMPKRVADQFLRSLMASGRAVSGIVYADIDADDTSAMHVVCWERAVLEDALPEHLRDMLESRTLRAAIQAPEMEFVPATDTPGMWFCIHTVPQFRGRGKKRHPIEDDIRIYETSAQGCNCPDRDIRLRRLQGLVECKHQIALRTHMATRKVEHAHGK